MKNCFLRALIPICLAALLAGCSSSRQKAAVGVGGLHPSPASVVIGYDEAGSPVYSESSASVPGSNRMRAWKASLSIDADNAEQAVTRALAAAAASGGYLESRSDGTWSGTSLNLRIPAAALESVIGSIEALGTVTARHVESEDVTDQYLDTDARLKNKLVLRERLRNLLDQATEVRDILAIETELNRVQGDIDSMTARIKSLQGRVEFAALNLTIRQTEPKKILGPLGWVFRGLFWGVEKLFVIRDPDSEPGALPAYAPASAVPPPPAPPPASSGPADMLRYSVQEGDSLEIISRLFVLSPDDIRRANPALEGREVSPGEILFIPPSSP